MQTIMKRIGSLALVLVLILTLLPTAMWSVSAAKSSAGTEVVSKLDFVKMESIAEGGTDEEKAASKAKAKDAIIKAGAVDAENLFLKGNHETIVNPGGYNGQGWYVQKATATSGEKITNAVLHLDYWVCTGDPQGYIEVHFSTDNQNYTKVWEQKKGNGDPYIYATRQNVAVELPVSGGPKELYVKVVMEHFQTYEGAAVACSTITLNRDPKSYQKVQSSKKPEECTMVTSINSFNALAPGEVTAEDIGAVDEVNMYFGIDEVPLLTPRNGYEAATATWKVEAAEGEPLHDCVLTMVGRTWWMTESVKNDNYLKVYASVDGKSFKEVKEFRSNDNEDDTQKIIVDVSSVVKGYAQAYVKLEWMVYDSPWIFGMRSVTLTGNTAGIDNSAGAPSKMAVSNVQSFTSLPVGGADKEALGAHKTGNLYFGYNKTPLLTATEAGEDAYAIWKINAMEGETFDDCWLTLVGRFGYVDAAKKESTALKVSVSTDAEKYTDVKTITPTEDQTDTQKIAIDLTAQAFGLSELYVKLYWTSKDDPAGMGLRSMSLVANAGADYDAYTPANEDRVITDEEMPAGDTTTTTTDAPDTDATKPVDTPKENNNGWIVWVIVAAVVVLAGGGFCVWWFVLRKKPEAAAEDAAEVTEEQPAEPTEESAADGETAE